MDNTRHKARRQPTMPASLSEARARRALYAMAQAQAEPAMRRCQLYMKEANQ
jgi:hypothetical protein